MCCILPEAPFSVAGGCVMPSSESRRNCRSELVGTKWDRKTPWEGPGHPLPGASPPSLCPTSLSGTLVLLMMQALDLCPGLS